MKKKLVSALLVTAMAASLLAGCGGDKASSAGTDGADAEDTQDAGADAEGEDGEAEPEAVTTVGPDSGTKMEMWSNCTTRSMHRCWKNGMRKILTDRFK